MKRLLLALGAVLALFLAVAWSDPAAPPRPEFDFKTEDKNPVTHLKLNNAPDSFQFAIVSDRTGGHRASVFSQAIEQLNLMQPEFVVTVGDLIEGYTTDKALLAKQWREFQGYVSRLQMPFFYTPGNHDFANKTEAAAWKAKFGRAYYEFSYRGVSFIILNSESDPGQRMATLGKEQLAWLEKTLADKKDARWTVVFLHRPMWLPPDVDRNGWADAEKLLKGRNYTVFAGHVHHYEKFVRQGMNYYSLATTGGISRLRGVKRGEFDHFVWVTMKKDGPVLANILLNGVLRENLSPIVTVEEGAIDYYRRPTRQVVVRVTLDGAPLVGAEVAFYGVGQPRQARGYGISGSDGVVPLSTYTANDGIPAGEYKVSVSLRKPRRTPEGKDGPNTIPEKYADSARSGLVVKIKASGKDEVHLDLSKGARP